MLLQECLRLAEELKNADARGNDMAEQLLVINKAGLLHSRVICTSMCCTCMATHPVKLCVSSPQVLQQELQRAKLRADSFEKCTRWRLRFACGKERAVI